MTNKPPCYTCKKSKKNVIETEDVIPKWYSKSKNSFSPYLAVPKVLVCKDKYNALKNDPNKKPKWKPDTPPTNGNQIILKENINYNNKWIFYWASDSSSNMSEVESAEEAYEKLENKGLIQTDENGIAEFILNCPQPYNVGGTIYPPHLHFVHLKDDKHWSIEKVETIEVNCRISLDNLREIIEAGDHIIINGMVSKKEEYNIPDSIKVTGSIEKPKVLEVLLKKIGKEKNNRDELKEINIKKLPIVVYSSKTSEKTISQNIKSTLLENGFVNVTEYNSKSSGWEDEYEGDYEKDEKDKKDKKDKKYKKVMCF